MADEYIVNPQTFIKTILNDDYSLSPKPTIDYHNAFKRYNHHLTSKGDHVLIGEEAQSQTQKDYLYNYVKREVTLRLDVKTTVDRDRLDTLFNEIHKIIVKNRRLSTSSDPDRNVATSGWSKLDYVNRQDLTNEQTKVYRYIMRIKLTAAYDFIGRFDS